MQEEKRRGKSKGAKRVELWTPCEKALETSNEVETAMPQTANATINMGRKGLTTENDLARTLPG